MNRDTVLARWLVKLRRPTRVRERSPRWFPVKWEDTYSLVRPCRLNVGVGLAESGQRRVEEPLLGWIKFGLDSYVDPDSLRLHRMRHEDYGDILLLVLWRTGSVVQDASYPIAM